jgi:hypothetical protein
MGDPGEGLICVFRYFFKYSANLPTTTTTTTTFSPTPALSEQQGPSTTTTTTAARVKHHIHQRLTSACTMVAPTAALALSKHGLSQWEALGCHVTAAKGTTFPGSMAIITIVCSKSKSFPRHAASAARCFGLIGLGWFGW